MRKPIAIAAAMTTAVVLGMGVVARGDSDVLVKMTVDATGQSHPISPLIYGINGDLKGSFAHATQMRMGGNRWTAYNWVTNASNAGSDWHFQNDDFMVGGPGLARLKDQPGGALVPTLEMAKAHHAQVIATVPMAGWVSGDAKADGDVRYPGGDVNKPKDPDYLKKRFNESRATKGSPFSLTPDPKSQIIYQDEFVNWLKSRWGSDEGMMFALDNEPDIWSGTHAEIHPDKPTYDEFVARTIEYATAIKAAWPSAVIMGPVNYGWNGFVTFQDAPDAKAKGDFQVYYLKKLAEAEKSSGKRLLDVFDVHWYPEARGGGVRISDPVTPGGGNGDKEKAAATVAARVQAPRSLWDPTYVEDSWITQASTQGKAIALIPYLKKKVEENYPGTKISINEYNYGGGTHISGAVAEADVLGIFGREGIYAADLWPLSDKEASIGAGFRAYRDFDGKGANFGDKSVNASTEDPEGTSVYASTDSKSGNTVVVLINKHDRPAKAEVTLKAIEAKKVELFKVVGKSTAPLPAGTVDVKDGTLSVEMEGMGVWTARIGG